MYVYITYGLCKCVCLFMLKCSGIIVRELSLRMCELCVLVQAACMAASASHPQAGSELKLPPSDSKEPLGPIFVQRAPGIVARIGAPYLTAARRARLSSDSRVRSRTDFMLSSTTSRSLPGPRPQEALETMSTEATPSLIQTRPAPAGSRWVLINGVPSMVPTLS